MSLPNSYTNYTTSRNELNSARDTVVGETMVKSSPGQAIGTIIVDSDGKNIWCVEVAGSSSGAEVTLSSGACIHFVLTGGTSITASSFYNYLKNWNGSLIQDFLNLCPDFRKLSKCEIYGSFAQAITFNLPKAFTNGTLIPSDDNTFAAAETAVCRKISTLATQLLTYSAKFLMKGNSSSVFLL